MKTVDRATDWVAIGTQDTVDREVRLWETGLLDALRAPAAHAVVGAARNESSYIILMRSVTDKLLPDGGQVGDSTLRLVIRAIASLQASFWQSDRLQKSELGLSSVSLFVGHTSPSTVTRIKEAMGGTAVTEFIAEGRDKLSGLIDPQLAATVTELADNPEPLVAAVDADLWTLAHGDIRPANVAATETSAVFLDWARPMVAPPTVDLMYWLFTANNQRPEDNDQWIDYHRSELETALGESINEKLWLRQTQVATAMVFTCMAQFQATNPPPAFQWWTDKASRAIAALC